MMRYGGVQTGVVVRGGIWGGVGGNVSGGGYCCGQGLGRFVALSQGLRRVALSQAVCSTTSTVCSAQSLQSKSFTICLSRQSSAF